VDALATNREQEIFLHNMALVALATRLTHALRNMAKSADTFAPRKGSYGNGSMSEFERLWVEYGERFGIDFTTPENAKRIAFIENMRKARNQIVHEGGEANPFKYMNEVVKAGDEELLETKFSEACSEYVSGTGASAVVCVTPEKLNENIQESLRLIEWLAGKLRRIQLASASKTSGTQ